MNDGHTIFSVRSLEDEVFRAASALRRGVPLECAAEQIRQSVSSKIQHENATRWLKWWITR